jgi:heme o synthase
MAVMMPRVMSLAVFTVLAGLIVASVHRDPLTAPIGILAIAPRAGAAGAIGHDAGIDAPMTRTAMRRPPHVMVYRAEAPVFGLILAIGEIFGIALVVRDAPRPALSILIYAVVYRYG